MYYPGWIKPGTVIHDAMTCVDFKPTVLALMGIQSQGPDEGRDCSALLTDGRTPAGWNDIIFMRGTGEEEGWVAAVTRQYKLVYSTRDDPWLFDLEKDPDELINFFTDERYRDTVRTLSRQLRDYGQTWKDPRVANRRNQADLAWAIEGTGSYVSGGPTSRPAPQAQQGKAQRRKAQGAYTVLPVRPINTRSRFLIAARLGDEPYGARAPIRSRGRA